VGEGARVTGTAREPVSGDDDATRSATWIVADLLDPAAARASVETAEPDVVVHLAGQAYVPRSWEDPAGTFHANTSMTINLLDAVRDVAPSAHVVLVASGEMYGPPERLPVDESAPLRPQNPYAVSKVATEVIGRFYADAHGLHVVRARAFNHAGPGQSPTYAISSFAKQVAAGQLAGDDPIRVVTGNPDARKDYTDVRDVVEAYRLLADAEPDAYNVCSGSSIGISEIVARLGVVTGTRVDHVVDEALVRRNEVTEIRGARDRITAATGWEPRIPLETTLSDAVDWWRGRLAHEGEAVQSQDASS
jgi:GDP-4-dehydro-6-deoxy-D-mannose reductase